MLTIWTRRFSAAFGSDSFLSLCLAVTHGHEARGGNLKVRDEVALDGFGAPFRQLLVGGVAPDGVGVAGDHEGAALELRARQRAAERADRRHRRRTDVRGREGKFDFDIDARPLLGDRRDVLALGGGERAARLVLDEVEELAVLAARRLGDRRAGQAAGRAGSSSAWRRASTTAGYVARGWYPGRVRRRSRP